MIGTLRVCWDVKVRRQMKLLVNIINHGSLKGFINEIFPRCSHLSSSSGRKGDIITPYCFKIECHWNQTTRSQSNLCLSISEYYELCLPNSRANIGLSLVDGIVCLILLVLSLLGIIHFCTYGFKLCFNSEGEPRRDPQHQIAMVLPGQSTGHGQIQGYYKRTV